MKRFLILTISLLVCTMLFSAQSSGSATEQAIKVSYVGESSSTDPVWSYRVKLLEEQAKENGIDFVYRYAEGDYSRHVRMIDEEIARGVDALVMPLWDPNIYNEVIVKAVEKGIYVFGIMGFAPRSSLPDNVLNKCGWIEIDQVDWGRDMGKISFEYVPDGGKVFWPAEVPSATYITEVIQGFEEYFDEQGKKCSIIVVEVTNDPTTAASRVTSFIIANRDTNAIITSGAIAAEASCVALGGLNMTSGSIPIIGQVTSPSTAAAIASGMMPVGLNMDDADAAQIVISDVIAVVRDGKEPTRKSVGYVTINKDNLEEVVPESQRK